MTTLRDLLKGRPAEISEDSKLENLLEIVNSPPVAEQSPVTVICHRDLCHKYSEK